MDEARCGATSQLVNGCAAHSSRRVLTRHLIYQEELTAIRQASPTADTVYTLAQQFMRMIRQLKGERLDDWLALVKASQIPELQSLVRSIKKDKAAVLAGLTLQHNNGVVEGKVNTLKLIKRMLFGRAGFPLLRQRVLPFL